MPGAQVPKFRRAIALALKHPQTRFYLDTARNLSAHSPRCFCRAFHGHSLSRPRVAVLRHTFHLPEVFNGVVFIVVLMFGAQVPKFRRAIALALKHPQTRFYLDTAPNLSAHSPRCFCRAFHGHSLSRPSVAVLRHTFHLPEVFNGVVFIVVLVFYSPIFGMYSSTCLMSQFLIR
jgi:hypothetical protein